MNSFKELVHLLVDSGAIIADSALLNFGELMLEGGKVFFKILHNFDYNWSQVQQLMIFVVAINPADFADKGVVAFSANLCQWEPMELANFRFTMNGSFLVF